MNVEIFVVSFRRDLQFCRYLMRSIQKFATGFSGVTVCVPFEDVEAFAFVPELGGKLKGYQDWPGNTMLAHEFQIMTADHWAPHADAILFVDSDCIFWEPVTPEDYFWNGKPILLRERFATLTNKLRLHWKTATYAATGIDPAFETMLRMPIIHIPEVLVKTREIIQSHTGLETGFYMRKCSSDFPQTFCEYVTLGSVAIEHLADRYHFQDFDVRTNDGGYPYQRGRDRMVAGWSHAGVDEYRDRWEEILK